MVTPAVLGIWIFILFPMLYAIYISFHDYILSQGGIKSFTFKNYTGIVSNELLGGAIENTLILTCSVVVLELVIGLGLAMLLNQKIIRLRGFYLFILLIPMLMPPITVGLIWRLLLHPELGIINYSLGLLGFPQPAWLANQNLAMVTIIIVDVWHETSFILLILLAGLTSLPDELYEAAVMDGTNSIQKFFHITLPLMKPTIFVALIIRFIAAMKTYDLVYILTRGGPGTSTETISYYIYKVAFVFLDMGRSSAMAFILLIFIVIVTLVLMRAMRTSEAQ
ncbi:MAG: sugar ABC transporter permease [Anaerolineaceae bacterium]|nr:sugar ABC transporter permease [Anaerolineaceae bacterium]